MQNEENVHQKLKELLKHRDWASIREAIELLKQHTGEGSIFDPYEDPDKLPWNDLGSLLLRSGRIMEALTVFQSQLQSYLGLQDKTKRRIHKGTPYHFLGEAYYFVGNLGYAREHFLLAFVEDILTEIQSRQGIEGLPKVQNAHDLPASIVLEVAFRMPKQQLSDLYGFAKGLVSENASNKWLYPELVILKWRNSKEKCRNKDKGLLITRAVEERLFHVNPYYLKDLLAACRRGNRVCPSIDQTQHDY